MDRARSRAEEGRTCGAHRGSRRHDVIDDEHAETGARTGGDETRADTSSTGAVACLLCGPEAAQETRGGQARRGRDMACDQLGVVDTAAHAPCLRRGGPRHRIDPGRHEGHEQSREHAGVASLVSVLQAGDSVLCRSAEFRCGRDGDVAETSGPAGDPLCTV